MTKEQNKIEQENHKELTAAERAEQIRKDRIKHRPYDGLSSRFPAIPPRTGYKTHWFNDHKGKIEQKLSLGWEFSKRAGFTDAKIDLVQHPNKRIRVHVGQKEDGSDMYAYAMDIPEEVAAEDRARRMEIVNQKERYIREGRTETQDAALKKIEKAEVTISQGVYKPD